MNLRVTDDTQQEKETTRVLCEWISCDKKEHFLLNCSVFHEIQAHAKLIEKVSLLRDDVHNT